MNPPEDQIENALRHAPRPIPHPSLRDQVVKAIALPEATPHGPSADSLRRSWLRRFWPALATGGIAVAAFALVVVQQTQINQLERRIEALHRELAQPPAESAPPSSPPPPDAVTVPRPNGTAELERLRARTREMAAEVKALETMPQENAQLKAQAAANLGLSAEALGELAKAREQAQRIACVNNLKQLGLAARIWATDHDDVLPPDLLSMSHEIVAPKILICPADPGRQPATDWASFTPANASYEFLAANSPETEPQRVAFRCPIHGNIGLVDGSVQMGVAKEHPDWLVQREGKLMLEAPRTPQASPPSEAGQVPQMDRRMMERYGLVPPGPNLNTPAPGLTQPMAEELMRRYGLLPRTNNPDATAPEPPPAPEDQP